MSWTSRLRSFVTRHRDFGIAMSEVAFYSVSLEKSEPSAYNIAVLFRSGAERVIQNNTEADVDAFEKGFVPSDNS